MVNFVISYRRTPLFVLWFCAHIIPTSVRKYGTNKGVRNCRN